MRQFLRRSILQSLVAALPLSFLAAGIAAHEGRSAALSEETDSARDASRDASRDARRELARIAAGEVDRKALPAVLERLAKAGGKVNIDAVLKLLAKVPASDELLYWSLIEGAASFVDREALVALGETLEKNARGAVARDLLYGLSGNRSPHLALALAEVVRKGPRDLKLLAVPKLGTVPSPESVDLLIELLKSEEKYLEQPENAELLWLVIEGLERLTGERMGPNSVNWQGWWEKNRGTARLGRGRGDDEEGSSSGTVVDSLDRSRKEEFIGLEQAPKKGVVVLSAVYEKPIQRDLNNDHIEQVLSRMGVPHEVVSRGEFIKYDLSMAGALVINCAQFHKFCICPTCKPGGDRTNRLYRCTGCNKHVEFSAELGAEAIKKIKAFVQNGGYVFGEDWVIKEVLEKAYSKYVSTGDVLLKKDVPTVDVVPARGMVAHPYLKGIFRRIADDDESGGGDDDEGGTTVVKKPPEDEPEARLMQIRHRWAIDDESWAFKVLDKEKVLVLMSSGELRDKLDGQSAVAFAFRPGESPETIGHKAPRGASGRRAGVVLQVLSHFGRQGSTRDEHLLQNILLNFLIDANVEREARLGPAARAGEKAKAKKKKKEEEQEAEPEDEDVDSDAESNAG